VTESDALSALVARSEILELTARYALYVDTGKLDALLDLFTDDAGFDESGVGLAKSEGRAALESYFGYLFNIIDGALHLTSNHVLHDLASDHARGTCSSIVVGIVGSTRTQVACRYDDDYVRTEDGWRFSSRVVSSYLPIDLAGLVEE